MRPKLLRIASFVLLILCAGLPVRPSWAAAGPYRVVEVTKQRVGPLLVTEETVQAGADPAARFQVHRIRKQAGARRGVLLLMPGGGSNFSLYTADEQDKLQQSFAGFFASRGFDVWGYSPRTTGLAAGACSGTVDCSGMRDWGMQAVVDDALYIRRRIRALYGSEKPVIGGFSLGAMSTVAVINASPNAWSGAILWEGMIYSEDPTVLAANGEVCTSLEAQIAAGGLYDEVSYSTLRLIYGLATSDPEGPSPLPGFEGLTNHQAFVLLMTSPQPAPPAYVPGYTYIAGSLESGLTFASEERIGLFVQPFNNYEPLALIRDYTCALGGERTFTGNLESFTAPVYVLGAGHGFGAWMDDQVEILGTTDVTRRFYPDFGHGDHYTSPEHRQILEGPLFAWLKQLTGH
jgi:pimeloyl-ACP methyl ester carboxylesterase